MKTFINVAQMKLATLQADQFVETGGYYAKGDAGAARYLIVAAQAADEYGDHTLVNGNVAALQVGDNVNVVEFGAKTTGSTDDTLAIQAAEDFCALEGRSLHFTYMHTLATGNYISKRSGVNWYGNLGGLIRAATSTVDVGSLVVANTIGNFSIDGIVFQNLYGEDTSRTATSPYKWNCCLTIFKSTDFNVTNCVFTRYNTGLNIAGCARFEVSHNVFKEASQITLLDMHAPTWTTSSAFGGGDIQSFTAFSESGWESTQDAYWWDYNVNNNICGGIGSDAGIVVGQQYYGPMHGVVSDNIIFGKNHGIQLYKGTFTDPGNMTDASTHCSILSNNIHDCFQNGIYIRGHGGLLVNDNIIDECGWVGPYNSGTDAGISVRVDLGLLVTVSDVDLYAPVVIDSNIISNFGKPDTGLASGGSAAVVARNNNMTVSGNVIYNDTKRFSGSGLGIQSYSFGYGLQAIGNTIKNVGTGISLLGTNIRPAEVDYYNRPTMISSNVIKDTTTGIELISQQQGATINNNIITNFITVGIRLRKTTDVLVSANTINFGSLWDSSGDSGGLVSNTGTLSSDIHSISSIINGTSVRTSNNVFLEVPTDGVAFKEYNVSGQDALVYNRFKQLGGDNQNGEPIVLAKSTSGLPNTGASSGNWNWSDKFYLTDNTTNEGNICTQGGTIGTSPSVTLSTVAGSSVLTLDLDKDLHTGMYFTLSTEGATIFKATQYNPFTQELSVEPAPAGTNTGVTAALSAPLWRVF